MRVERIMRADPRCCEISDTLHAVARTMWRLGCNALPLCGPDGELLGQVDTQSIYRITCVDGNSIVGLRVADVPVSDACSCSASTDVADALALMTKEHASRLFVVDDHRRLIGFVALRTIAEAAGAPVTKIRRLERDSEYDHADRYAGWTLIVAHLRLVSPSGEVFSIQRNLLRLLLVFLEKPGVTLSRSLLLQRVCNRKWDASDRYIDVLVGQLRRKFSDDAASQRVIRTAHGRGYVFMLDVEPCAKPSRTGIASPDARSDRRAANAAVALVV